MGAFVSALRKIDLMLKESRDFFLEIFKKSKVIFVCLLPIKIHLTKRKKSFNLYMYYLEKNRF